MRQTLTFHLRKMLCFWRREVLPSDWLMNLEAPAYRLPNTPESQALQRALERQYPLIHSLPNTWQWVRLESFYQLAQLDALQKRLSLAMQPHCHWVDVGSKNAATLPACLAVADTLGERVSLTAIEMDPYRHYLDGYTRGDYARGLLQGLKSLTPHSIQWIEGDVIDYAQDQAQTADVVSCFLPFVLQLEHDAWGLPTDAFAPLAFFQALWRLLKPNGVLLLSNLSQDEVEVQQKWIHALVDSLPSHEKLIIQVQALEVPTAFMKCQEERRYLWWIQKQVHGSC